MCNIARILFDKGEIDSALEIFNKNLVDSKNLEINITMESF